MRALTSLAMAAVGVLVSAPAAAAPAAGGGDVFGRPLFLVAALALMSLLPIVFTACTAFVKISTVLQIARNAIGAQNVPSNTVVLALAASLSVVAMAPVASAISAKASPLVARAGELDTPTLIAEGISAVGGPLRSFLTANADPREVARFAAVAKAARAPEHRDEVKDTDVAVVLPAFLVSELARAFALGVAIYLPFLVLDLVVANVLVAGGLSSLSPGQVSLPLKLLLFLAVDGWGLLSRALVLGYRFNA
jgi:type III secretion protein R